MTNYKLCVKDSKYKLCIKPKKHTDKCNKNCICDRCICRKKRCQYIQKNIIFNAKSTQVKYLAKSIKKYY